MLFKTIGIASNITALSMCAHSPCKIDDNTSNSTTDHSRATHQIISISSTVTHLSTITFPRLPNISSTTPPPHSFPMPQPDPQSTTTTLTPTHPDCHRDRTYPFADLQPHPNPPLNAKTQKLSKTGLPVMKVSVTVFCASINQLQCVRSPDA